MLETEGSNLALALALDKVDHIRSTTNNCVEIGFVLGIEAARKILIKEIRTILDFYGIYVNVRHLALISDLMTHKGKITSISRHGINRIIEGPLRRASFEETVEILFEAGVFAKEQNFYGVTENLMFGQLAPIGSGSFKLLFDINKTIKEDFRYIPDTDVFSFLEQEIKIDQTEILEEKTNNDKTPEYMHTPSYNIGDKPDTPRLSNRIANSPSHPFTPITMETSSPAYQNITGNERASPNVQSPLPFINPKNVIFSPSYKPSSPQYHSPNSSPRSQSHSPPISHSPSSPNYIGSGASSSSPTYSSGGGGKNYSPASPGYYYNSKSPQYNQSNSPLSPQYSINSNKDTPNSNNSSHNQKNNSVYSPSSPSYNSILNNAYKQSSPIYDLSSKGTLSSDDSKKTKEPKEPGLTKIEHLNDPK